MTVMMLSNDLLCRIVRFKGEDHSGAGFFVDHDGGTFLVTAKHNTTQEREEYVQVRQAYGDETFHGSYLERVGDLSLSHDVAVFRIPDSFRPLWYEGAIELSTPGDLFYAQDCLILGYPARQGERSESPGIELPLIKKGILSGKQDVDGTTYWIVDVMANPGFSGGPLVCLQPGRQAYLFAGVVKAAEHGEVGGLPRLPTGFSYCVESTHILELLG